MIKFGFNGELKLITAKIVSDYYNYPRLKDGLRQRDGSFLYPLNDQNVDILFRYHEKDEKTLFLKEVVVDFIEKKKNNSSSELFLHSLNMNNIGNLPYLYKYSDLTPFKNQHISQYWGSKTEEHSMLWDMGTGKTRAAIEIYEIKKQQNKVSRGMVLCPLSMVNKWIDEIEKWSKGVAVPLRGKEKIEIIKEDWEWYVCTYETFSIIKDEILNVIDKSWYIVLDESTKIKNPKAKRSKACHELGTRTKHKIILTGTPVTQHAYDLFSQFLFLDCGETFGINYDNFIDRYFWKAGYRLIAKNGSLGEMSKKTFNKSTRFLKKDCIDIPDKLYDNRILELPTFNKTKYDEMVKWCITQIEGSNKVTAPIILTQLLRLSQITSGFLKDVTNNIIPFKENPKLDALKDILESNNGNKIIIWSRFQFDIKQIITLCKEIEIKAVSIYGETSESERYENIKAFQEDKDCKVIVGTAGTGGHGIDLTAANTVIYYSNSYSLEQRLQSEDRAHRAGQKNQVQYIDLLCKDTIDISIYKILRGKKSIADIITKDNLRSLL